VHDDQRGSLGLVDAVLDRAVDRLQVVTVFDVLNGAQPTFGPAARPLPQLPLDVDAEGYLVAKGDFTAPVGPGFWNRGDGP